eukprot:4915294-Amphidinium_carterae.1
MSARLGAGATSIQPLTRNVGESIHRYMEGANVPGLADAIRTPTRMVPPTPRPQANTWLRASARGRAHLVHLGRSTIYTSGELVAHCGKLVSPSLDGERCATCLSCTQWHLAYHPPDPSLGFARPIPSGAAGSQAAVGTGGLA